MFSFLKYYIDYTILKVQLKELSERKRSRNTNVLRECFLQDPYTQNIVHLSDLLGCIVPYLIV